MVHTIQGAYVRLRSDFVTSDDQALDGTTSSYTYKWDDKPTEALEVGPESNAVEIIFYGKAAADKTFSWKLWAWRENGPAKYIAHGTGALGTAVQGTANTYFADTLVITAQAWLKGVGRKDNANNRITSLALDLCGYKYIYIEFTDVGGGGAECSAVQAELAFF